MPSDNLPHRIVRTLALTIALVAIPAALRADQAETPPQAKPDQSLVDRADALLADARSSSEAALRWLRANVPQALAAQLADGAQSSAERQWERLLEIARQEQEQRLGAFLYTPGANNPHTADWTPVADLPPEPETAHVVLLIHGLDEPGDIWNDLAPALADAGHTVARFNYPNDQDPADSADALTESLLAMKRELHTDSIDIVAHSMGGLIARDFLTRPDLYPADEQPDGALPSVGRLITIGTPNQGSAFAPLRSIGEIREHFARWLDSRGSDKTALLGFVSDGDGAAADALTPGSEYLSDLNSRPLPEGLAITVIIGRASPVEAADLEPLLSSRFATTVLGQQRIDRLRGQTDQVVGTLGDGVVTVESARLPGAKDTLILDANHRSLVRRTEIVDRASRMIGREPRDPPAIAVILDRLDDDE